MSPFRRQVRTVEIGTFLTLAAVILATLFCSVVGLRLLDQTAAHRPPPPATPASLREAISYPGGFKYYFERAFATRDLCLELHGRLMVDGLATSPSPNVALGTDGWLFLKSESSLQQYRRLDPFSPRELSEWVDAAAAWQAAAEQGGAQFVMLVAPNKYSVYPEHVDDRFTVASRPGRKEEFVDAARAAGLTIVDPNDALVRAKADARCYHLTDTHWNQYGAAIAARELTTAFGPLLGEPVEPSSIERRTRSENGGDLSRQIGMARLMPEEIFSVSLEPPREVATADGSPIPEPGFDNRGGFLDHFDPRQRLVTHCADGEYDSAIVYIDSFGEVMLPVLARHFKRCVFVKGFSLDPELIANEKPSVVVLEVVERRLSLPAAEVLLRQAAAAVPQGAH
ncbi:hypothetical protein Pla123a_00430 [Posidoniimonas polymericola]|uniref:AlgX/AlgJ SGNH hydrolase-like domain-containing protein n=1 Tax=Posidoniimonas polymericola TaxID=2528002 RepID=A0A5C5ZDT8_9BACT|nr:hypothetical protein [Posidoniimonas polymericola]TWT85237.1 hypothetical protein Pla123a_00430 [Posidoniimonas polymericola]